MEILNQYIIVIIMSICLCFGYVIKNSLDIIPNKFIPVIMAVLGIILNIWLNNGLFTPEILLGGMASGLASTGAFEIMKNITDEKRNSTKLPK